MWFEWLSNICLDLSTFISIEASKYNAVTPIFLWSVKLNMEIIQNEILNTLENRFDVNEFTLIVRHSLLLAITYCFSKYDTIYHIITIQTNNNLILLEYTNTVISKNNFLSKLKSISFHSTGDILSMDWKNLLVSNQDFQELQKKAIYYPNLWLLEKLSFVATFHYWLKCVSSYGKQIFLVFKESA